ncbi:MAG: sulfide/dihydroorotate dehydrogenase-like FAD/NAD-binding protein [Eubacteriales bacterium]|nr:sulfide/dihydroorotate dehydrogenase-like FAD/NAD-binding protein [Bacillota bacterium]MBV1727361.1 sulfide/dihydroorotate dehydrogenase-like FAD/NAD-binding protein [Desulforudis sp.]MDZ4043490.1 sulfide/dihydroorotate dehydrogenase-like FAD/NAD-binding protein [Eubacteriales bacterium]MBU4533492.1 sulfide/dihydroorotate dehydrogenase-like FAD/NAD-binding protein [Bacillota bacterium]MBU4554864.1 sulfide/dihydroorotate dehydrogenase-like FAD/NAD-binding protein [Bacillota bacterium]
MYPIVVKRTLAPGVRLYEIRAPLVARKAQPGQFVIIRVNETGERIPLTIADFDREFGMITMVVQEIGFTTKTLAKMEVGDDLLDFIGPLGNPSKLPDSGTVVCIGGGVGCAPLYPQVRALGEKGVNVITIVGARSAENLILTRELGRYSKELHITTDDGSEGRKGFVSDVLKELIEKGTPIDEVIAIGPMIMMKVVSGVTKQYAIPTVISLNSLMVDGTGMCGSCRVTVGGVTKFACVDGPEFDAHQIDFDEQMKRSAVYRDQEAKALERLNCGCRNGH